MREPAGFPANNITMHIHGRLHVGIHNAVVYPSQKKSFWLGVFVNGLQDRWERLRLRVLVDRTTVREAIETFVRVSASPSPAR